MFVISWFTSRNGVCKLLCWKEINVEFLSLLHDPFTLIFSVSSLFWLILLRSFILFPFGCQECHELINTLYDPSVLVTKEILSGAEKSHFLWLSLLWSILRFIIARYSKFTTPQINIISLTRNKINLAQICPTDIWKFQIHLLRSRVESPGRTSKVVGGENDLREISVRVRGN